MTVTYIPEPEDTDDLLDEEFDGEMPLPYLLPGQRQSTYEPAWA